MASGKFHGAMTTATPRGRQSKCGCPRRGASTLRPLGEPLRLLGVVVAEVDGLAHVGVGLAPGLAGLEDLPGREAVDAPRSAPGDLAQIAGAFARRQPAPGGKGGARGL